MEGPEIRTELPGPKAREYLEWSQRFEPRSMSEQVPLVWARARGCIIEDVDGNRFLDFTSGVLVTNVGHCHPEYVAAVKEQAERLYNCYDFVTPQRAALAKKLVELTPPHLTKAFILTTGSEAVEAAIKMARRFTGRYEVIAFHGAFHGRTYMAMSVGGKAGVKRGFGPLVPGILHAPFCYCYRCPFGKEVSTCNLFCLDYLDYLLETESTGSVAAVITETYQGAAGSIVPPPGYMERLQEWCRRQGALLILDEVQSSFGRTGKMFAFQHWDIEPDLVCLGKGIGSGVPCAAVVGRGEIMDVLEPGSLSSTYGGNPLSCAAALKAIEILEKEGLVENAARVGEFMLRRFREMQERYEILGDVRGMGLALGLEIVRSKATKEPAPELAKRLVRGCFERGLALIAPIGFYGNVLRVAPPLVITEAQARWGVEVMEKVLQELSG